MLLAAGGDVMLSKALFSSFSCFSDQCDLGLKIWAGEPKSVGSNLSAFMKHPPCGCFNQTIQYFKMKNADYILYQS